MFATEQYAQVFIDCAIINPAEELIFISLYGGENSINRMLAAIENNNLKQLDFYGEQTFHRIYFPDKKSLQSKKSKIVNPTFEHFVHCFVFDRGVRFTEGASQSHVLVPSNAHYYHHVWTRIKSMTVTPLLDSWRNIIVDQLFDQEKIIPNTVAMAPDHLKLQCYTIRLGLLDLNAMVVEMLKNRQLTLPT